MTKEQKTESEGQIVTLFQSAVKRFVPFNKKCLHDINNIPPRRAGKSLHFSLTWGIFFGMCYFGEEKKEQQEVI